MTDGARHVRVRLDGTRCRHWHVGLLERLAACSNVTLSLDAAPGPGSLPETADLLFRLETAINSLDSQGLSASVDLKALQRFDTAASATPDLVIDCCGDVADGPAPVWHLRFDGVPGEAGLLAALIEGRAPVATLARSGTTMTAGRLGTENAGIVRLAFEDGLARTITLVAAAVAGNATAVLPSSDDDEPGIARGLGMPDVAWRTGKALARAVVRRLYHLCFYAPHWRVGWRRVGAGDLIDLRRHPEGGWNDLPDDGLRFYADPFAIEHRGAVTLFVEDYDHRRRKGHISAVRFDAKGPIGKPEPVLDLPYHLSYPFVFEEDGAIWMIPESCAAGRIDLFRATRFPGGWVHEAVLVDDVVASDATLLRKDGRWWMFATVRDGGGAYSDVLHLWSAPSFKGPWTPHVKNPVLIDIASARPAGRIVERDGVLFRPVQDCRRGYGNALALARITRLDDESFEQIVETVLRAGAGWPGTRLHTLNAAGGFEFIDGSARARRRWFAKRMPLSVPRLSPADQIS